MLESQLARLLTLAEVPSSTVLDSDRTPAAGKPVFVAQFIEDLDRLTCDLECVVRAGRVDHAAHRRLLEQRVPLLTLVPRSRRSRDDAVQQRLGARHLAERPEREPELP